MAKAVFYPITDAEAESRGANGIRYPGSPGRKRWALSRGDSEVLSAGANVLSAPPGEYDRKIKTQRN